LRVGATVPLRDGLLDPSGGSFFVKLLLPASI
jgi:hypothetical protein